MKNLDPPNNPDAKIAWTIQEVWELALSVKCPRV